jgi:hypothetical protein
MNGMGQGMQNMQNMQHRYPGERDREREPPKTPIRSYSAQTPPHNGNQTPPPSGGCCGRRLGLGTGGQNGPQADADVMQHPLHRSTV